MMVATTLVSDKELHKQSYLELQKQWKSKDKELLLVGRLAYWTFFLSKYAEEKVLQKEREELFDLKLKVLTLFTKSKYVKIKKYIPTLHKKLCRRHARIIFGNNIPLHSYLNHRKYHRSSTKCKDCLKGKKHHYSLYSVAILNGFGEVDKKIQFIFFSPYRLLKENFPAFKELEEVKTPYKSEIGRILINNPISRKVNPVYSEKFVIKKAKEGYELLKEYLQS